MTVVMITITGKTTYDTVVRTAIGNGRSIARGDGDTTSGMM